MGECSAPGCALVWLLDCRGGDLAERTGYRTGLSLGAWSWPWSFPLKVSVPCVISESGRQAHAVVPPAVLLASKPSLLLPGTFRS